MADHRPDVYTREEDDTLVFRASSFARCDRALIAAGVGLEPSPPPERMLKAFSRGQEAEWEILTQLGSKKGEVRWTDGSVVKLGYNILDPGLMGSYRNMGPAVSREPHDGQFAIELELGDGMVCAGHMDGAGSVYISGESAIETGTTLVLEAKRFGPDYFARWREQGLKGWPAYDVQTDLYMLASGCPLLFLVGEGKAPEEGAEDELLGVWAELKLKPSRPLGYYRMRARRLRAQIEAGVVPEECERGVEYPCPFWWMHEDAGKERIDLSGREDDDEQVQRIAELAAIIVPRAAAAKVEDAALKELKTELRDLVIAVAGGNGRAVTTRQFDISHVYTTWEASSKVVEKKAGSKSYVLVNER